MIIAGLVLGSIATYLFIGACFARFVYVCSSTASQAGMRNSDGEIAGWTLGWPLALSFIVVAGVIWGLTRVPASWIGSFTRPASGRLFPHRIPRKQKEKQQTIEEGYPEVLKEVGRNESA